MKLGIGSYAVPWHIGIGDWRPPQPLQPENLIEMAHTLGLQVVQYCDNMPIHHWLYEDPERLDRLQNEAEKRGIDVEVGTRGLNRERLQDYAILAQRFGSPFVRVVVDEPGYHPTPDELVEHLRTVEGIFTSRNLKLAIENHDRFPAKVIAQIVQRVGEGWVGICFDTANSLGTLQGPNESLKPLCPYVCNLHVKDVVARREDHMLGFRIEGAPAGEGIVDVIGVMRQVHRANPEANAIIELWTPPQQSIEETIALEQEWLERSAQNLKSLLHSL